MGPTESRRDATEPAPRRLQTQAILAAVGSRVFVFLVAFAAGLLVGVNERPIGWRFPAQAEVFQGNLGHLLNPWAHWDGVWFIKIAARGYAADGGSTAFFPLLPSLLRYGGYLFGGNLVLTGIAISLLSYAGAMALLYRLVRLDFNDRTASRTVIYLAVAPFTLFFQAVYTESLFLLLTLACFVFAREGRFRLAGVIGLFAVLTRSTGILLLIPMTYYYYEQRGWRLRRTDSHVANLLIVPEGLLIWMTYLSLAFGNPLSFAGAQVQWARSLAAPNYTVGRALSAALDGIWRLVSTDYARLSASIPTEWGWLDQAATNIVAFASFVLAALLLWYGARRLPPVYSLFALASVAYPLFFPAHSLPLMSFPRFALVVFPLYISLALFTETRRWAHIAVIAGGLVLLAVLTFKFALFSWVA